MFNQLRIRWLLFILVAGSIGAITALALTGIVSVRLLDRHQDRLTAVALPLLKQNVNVYATVSELTRQLLTAQNADEQDNAQISIEQIQASYGELEALVEQVPEAAVVLQTVKTQFTNFVERDIELQAAHAELAQIEHELTLLNKRIEDSVRLSEQNAQTISGRTRLATFRQKRALRRQLAGTSARQPLGPQTRQAVDDLLIGKTSEIPTLATSVQYNVVSLAELTRQLMLANTRDDIVSLRENRMTQTAKRLNKQLDALMASSHEQTALANQFVILKAAVAGLIAQSVAPDNSAYAMRLNWLDKHTRAETASSASHEAIGALLVGLGELAKLAQNTSDDVSAASVQVISTSSIALVAVSLVVATLVMLFGLVVRNRVNSAFGDALTIAQCIGNGRLDTDIDTSRSDEGGELLIALDQMQQALRDAREQSAALLSKASRAQQALDSVESSVMVADADNTIVYLNESAQQLFHSAEADLRDAVPAFSAAGLKGGSLTTLFGHFGLSATAPEGQPHEVSVGKRTLRCTAGTVVDDNGQRVGTVVEWRDRTEEVSVEHEVQELVDAARHGNLDQRIACDSKTGFFKTLGGSINELLSATSGVIDDTLRVLGALSRGDLSQTIDGDYEGSFGQLKSDANATVAKLDSVMAQITSSSQLANKSAIEIRESGVQLSERSESQASGLAETASSMSQMTRTVRENADNAQQAKSIAADALDQAESGGQVVGQAVDAMVGIRSSSAKIAEIIGVIDEIAFQTNLLALNASVEAARAGERGRGFAVVASEVRDLAGRSATAASEIKELIENSVSQVDQGYRLVEASGETLQQIVHCVKEVTEIVASIATASQEQSQGITQVNQAVTHMDKMTQESALMVSRFAEASVALGGQAQRMRELVGFFSLGASSTPSATPAENHRAA